MILYFIGMPSSGKSTLAAEVAEETGMAMIDLDKVIEEKEARTINEIFEMDGEDYFRKLEAQTLMEVSLGENTIIAVGGGTPCHFNNMEFMNLNGITIFLDVSPEELFDRMQMNQGAFDRPLLADIPEDQLLEDLDIKRSKRLNYYKKAHLTIKTDHLTRDQLIDYIEAKFGSEEDEEIEEEY